MLREILLIFAAFAVFTDATQVNQCDTGTPFADSDQINISNCIKCPCMLKKEMMVNITIKFIPNGTINNLTNDVKARMPGLSAQMPFIGVDGTDACQNIYNADGTEAKWPLTKGTEYNYKNSFLVKKAYPSMSLTVRYALKEGINQVICFEIPSKITA